MRLAVQCRDRSLPPPPGEGGREATGWGRFGAGSADACVAESLPPCRRCAPTSLPQAGGRGFGACFFAACFQSVRGGMAERRAFARRRELNTVSAKDRRSARVVFDAPGSSRLLLAGDLGPRAAGRDGDDRLLDRTCCDMPLDLRVFHPFDLRVRMTPARPAPSAPAAASVRRPSEPPLRRDGAIIRGPGRGGRVDDAVFFYCVGKSGGWVGGLWGLAAAHGPFSLKGRRKRSFAQPARAHDCTDRP